MAYSPRIAKKTKKRFSVLPVIAAVVILAVIWLLSYGQEKGEEIPTVTVPETTEAAAAPVEVSEYTRIEGAVQSDIRDVKEAVLMLEGKPLLCVTEPEYVKALEDMFTSAQNLGYEPQTVILGVELLLIRDDGMAVEVELGLLEDLCRMNGEYYDYGPGMSGEASNNGMEELYQLLGLRSWTLETLIKWPVEVAQRYDYVLNSYLNDPKPVNTSFRASHFLPGRDSLVIRMADGREISVEDGYLDILRPLHFSQMDLAITPSGDVNGQYEIIITYGNGDGVRNLYYQGENEYLVCIDWGDGPKYRSLVCPELAEAAARWTEIR